jgi:hypothetical protein
MGRGELEEAERLFLSSQAAFHQIGNVEGELAVLAGLGQLFLRRGQPALAVERLQTARDGFARLGFIPWVQRLDQLLRLIKS